MKPLRLATLKSPAELQNRSLEELEALCGEIRSELLSRVLRTGGHLGSNLGVVELTVALHHVFDLSRDRLVFDVSHQCYPHKMLTGRLEGFDKLRRTDGLSGFCSREESDYDMLTAGHAGTAISYSLGLAEGLRGTGGVIDEDGSEGDPWAIAFVGDAGFGAGVSFEGLNQASNRNARLLVVLNDNEWSIARSVGALARYLSRIRSSRTLHKTYERLKSLAQSLPLVGSRMDEIGEVLRHVLVPGHVFEELGVNYIGPLDGHDMDQVTDALRRAKRLPGPTLLHFLTEKGKGYAPASGDPERAHGVKPSTPMEAGAKVLGSSAAATSGPPRRSYTAVFGDALAALAREDETVHAITAGMPSGTGLSDFAEEFPDRFHDTGITEQHAVALAGGMAVSGLKPVAAIYSTFLQRGYDQVFQEVALQGAGVVLALDRAGLVGQDGPTHMGLYDLAYLRPLPGITLASPRDAVDLERMLRAGVDAEGPWALRWPRGEAVECLGASVEERPSMVAGVAERLRDGRDGAVFALGSMVEPALEAAAILERDHDLYLEVWDARFCKPLDREAILGAAQRTGRIATVEEHGVQAGFGAAVAELLAAAGQRPVLHLSGVGDRFVPHMSSRDEQLAVCGLDVDGLVRAWRATFQIEHSHEPQA